MKYVLCSDGGPLNSSSWSSDFKIKFSAYKHLAKEVAVWNIIDILLYVFHTNPKISCPKVPKLMSIVTSPSFVFYSAPRPLHLN